MDINNSKKKIKVKPIKVEHGQVKSTCYIIDKKLEFLIIDCLWYNFHPSNFNLEKSLYFIKKFKPKKAILINLSPVLDYKKLKDKLPKNVIPAHDGLTLTL